MKNKFLLDLARRAIESELEMEKLATGEIPEEFKAKNACFVTLTIEGRLRGCIGNLEPKDELWKSVASNAISAAFGDPRFWPLRKEELEKVEIEISILDSPKVLKSKSLKDLLDYLRKNKPGVIVEKKGYSATFLPQVWEELRSPEEFLSKLCLKAGLEEDEWQRGVGIKTYSVKSVS